MSSDSSPPPIDNQQPQPRVEGEGERPPAPKIPKLEPSTSAGTGTSAECDLLAINLKVEGDKPTNERTYLHFLRNELYTDCQFKVGMTEDNCRVIKCHRLIMATSSPVFEAMLFGPLAEREEIDIVDAEPDIFRAMVEFIYSDSISSERFRDLEFVKKFLVLADKYLLESLKKKIIAFLQTNIQTYALVALEITVTVLQDEFALKNKALNEITDYSSLLLNENQVVFLQLSKEALSLIVKRKLRLRVHQSTFIDLCYKWAVERSDTLNRDGYRQTLGEEIFNNLQFRSLTPLEFVQLNKRIDLLTNDEKWEMLSTIVTNTPEPPAGPGELRLNINPNPLNPNPTASTARRGSSINLLPYYANALRNIGGGCTNSFERAHPISLTRDRDREPIGSIGSLRYPRHLGVPFHHYMRHGVQQRRLPNTSNATAEDLRARFDRATSPPPPPSNYVEMLRRLGEASGFDEDAELNW